MWLETRCVSVCVCLLGWISRPISALSDSSRGVQDSAENWWNELWGRVEAIYRWSDAHTHWSFDTISHVDTQQTASVACEASSHCRRNWLDFHYDRLSLLIVLMTNFHMSSIVTFDCNKNLATTPGLFEWCFRGIDSFGWYNNLRTIIYKSQPNSLITLTFRSHHETFIRRSWYSVLPDLDVTINCHMKMWQLIVTSTSHQHHIVTSTSGRNEYQLLLMKVSWWDQNVCQGN